MLAGYGIGFALSSATLLFLGVPVSFKNVLLSVVISSFATVGFAADVSDLYATIGRIQGELSDNRDRYSASDLSQMSDLLNDALHLK